MLISRFLSQNQDKIVLIVGAILIAAIGFAGGRLSVLQKQAEPIIIEESDQLCSCPKEGSVAGDQATDKQAAPEAKEELSSKTDLSSSNSQTTTQEGKYVGSKNSKKYHLPDCQYAKKIKEENQTWFKSAKEALDAGYEPCGTCKPPNSD
jgi:hypothetical protein